MLVVLSQQERSKPKGFPRVRSAALSQRQPRFPQQRRFTIARTLTRRALSSDNRSEEDNATYDYDTSDIRPCPHGHGNPFGVQDAISVPHVCVIYPVTNGESEELMGRSPEWKRSVLSEIKSSELWTSMSGQWTLVNS